MENEIKKVLEMVKDRKISPEDGERLITAIKQSGEKKEGKVKGKFLRMVIKDEEDSLNLRIPVLLIKLGLKFVPKESLKVMMDGEKVDIPLREIVATFEEGKTDILMIETSDGETLKIWIE